jgi:hypothetical protein
MPTINTVVAGDKLDNGATVIDIGMYRGRTFVLCITPIEMTDDRYASWEITDRGVTVDGWYDDDTLDEALAGFKQRCERGY